MIQAHGAQNGDVGIDDVGGIEPPAQPHFKNRGVDAAGTKHQQCRQRVEFKVGQRLAAARGLDLLEGIAQLRVRHLGSIDRDALLVAPQVRRGKQADALAVGLGHRGQERGG